MANQNQPPYGQWYHIHANPYYNPAPPPPPGGSSSQNPLGRDWFLNQQIAQAPIQAAQDLYARQGQLYAQQQSFINQSQYIGSYYQQQLTRYNESQTFANIQQSGGGLGQSIGLSGVGAGGAVIGGALAAGVAVPPIGLALLAGGAVLAGLGAISSSYGNYTSQQNQAMLQRASILNELEHTRVLSSAGAGNIDFFGSLDKLNAPMATVQIAATSQEMARQQTLSGYGSLSPMLASMAQKLAVGANGIVDPTRQGDIAKLMQIYQAADPTDKGDKSPFGAGKVSRNAEQRIALATEINKREKLGLDYVSDAELDESTGEITISGGINYGSVGGLGGSTGGTVKRTVKGKAKKDEILTDGLVLKSPDILLRNALLGGEEGLNALTANRQLIGKDADEYIALSKSMETSRREAGGYSVEVSGWMAIGDPEKAYRASLEYTDRLRYQYSQLMRSNDPTSQAQARRIAGQAQQGVGQRLQVGDVREMLGVMPHMASLASAQGVAQRWSTPENIVATKQAEYELAQAQENMIRSRLSDSEVQLSPQRRADWETKLAEAAERTKTALEMVGRASAELSTSVKSTVSGLAIAQVTINSIAGRGGFGAQEDAFVARRASEDKMQSISAEMSNLEKQGLASGMSLDAVHRTESYRNKATELAEEGKVRQSLDVESAGMMTSTGLRREESRLGFQAQILTTMPGAYGSIKRTLRGEMENYEAQIAEKRQQRERYISDNGGISEERELQYQNDIQNLQLKQASAYQQLSYGWQNRLVSSMINTPGNFAIASPLIAFRAAVGAGVRAPNMGSNADNLPSFMRDAMAHSIAGADGTPSGFQVTALTGSGRMEGHDGIGMPRASTGRTESLLSDIRNILKSIAGSENQSFAVRQGGNPVGVRGTPTNQRALQTRAQ